MGLVQRLGDFLEQFQVLGRNPGQVRDLLQQVGDGLLFGFVGFGARLGDSYRFGAAKRNGWAHGRIIGLGEGPVRTTSPGPRVFMSSFEEPRSD